MDKILWTIFWVLFGGFSGIFFNLILKRLFLSTSKYNPENLLNFSYLIAFITLLFIFLMLYLSFKQSIDSGFGYLVFYLIFSQIGIFNFVKTKNNSRIF